MMYFIASFLPGVLSTQKAPLSKTSAGNSCDRKNFLSNVCRRQCLVKFECAVVVVSLSEFVSKRIQPWKLKDWPRIPTEFQIAFLDVYERDTDVIYEMDSALREKEKDSALREKILEKDSALREKILEKDSALREKILEKDSALREKILEKDSALREKILEMDLVLREQKLKTEMALREQESGYLLLLDHMGKLSVRAVIEQLEAQCMRRFVEEKMLDSKESQKLYRTKQWKLIFEKNPEWLSIINKCSNTELNSAEAGHKISNLYQTLSNNVHTLRYVGIQQIAIIWKQAQAHSEEENCIIEAILRWRGLDPKESIVEINADEINVEK